MNSSDKSSGIVFIFRRSRFVFDKTKSGGFSLMELLIVIGIIVCLAALLFPSMTKARDSAITSKCISNQRTIFFALMAYAHDHDFTFPVSTPGSNRWFYQISTYISGFETASVTDPSTGGMVSSYAKIVICPIPEHAGWTGATGTYGLLEGFGCYDSGVPSDYVPYRISKISRPGKLPILCCEGPFVGGHRMTTTGPNPWAQEKYGYEGTTRNFGPGPNHGGKCNFTFLDGHIETHDVTKRDQWPWNDPNAFKME